MEEGKCKRFWRKDAEKHEAKGNTDGQITQRSREEEERTER